jgi:tetratricopeptide (TPR) repeat protein
VLPGLLSADIAEKKYDAARARIDAALAKSPKDAGLLVLAGNTYVAMNDIPKALSAFDSATQNDPSNLEAFSKLAVLYHSQGRLDDAKQKYERLVQLRTALWSRSRFLASLRSSKTRPATSQEPARRRSRSSCRYRVEQPRVDLRESGDNLDLALQLAQTAKSQLPNVAQINDTLADSTRRTSSRGGHALEEATKQEPANATIHRWARHLKQGNGRAAKLPILEAPADPTSRR